MHIEIHERNVLRQNDETSRDVNAELSSHVSTITDEGGSFRVSVCVYLSRDKSKDLRASQLDEISA